MDGVGTFFELFGVKLYPITKQRVYSLLEEASVRELNEEPDIKLPMDLIIQDLEHDQQLPLFRFVFATYRAIWWSFQHLTPRTPTVTHFDCTPPTRPNSIHLIPTPPHSHPKHPPHSHVHSNNTQLQG